MNLENTFVCPRGCRYILKCELTIIIKVNYKNEIKSVK